MRLPVLAAPVLLAVSGAALFVASPGLAGSDRVSAEAPLVTYGAALPEAAAAEVRVEYDPVGDTHVDLEVTGLEPGTVYVVRAHVDGCTPRRAGLGEVWQAAPNPEPEEHPQDPAYRNPVNEVWLDVETDRSGAGSAEATQPWQFHPTWRPGSVIIHRMLPAVRPTDPVVGPALGCLEVAF